MRPLLFLALTLSACSPSDPPPAEAQIAAADSSAGRPLVVDGEMAFSTRLPDGVTFGQVSSGEGESNAFQINGHDALVVFVPAPGGGFDDAWVYARQFAGDSTEIKVGPSPGILRWQVGGRENTLTQGVNAKRRFYIRQSLSEADPSSEAVLVGAVLDAWVWKPVD